MRERIALNGRFTGVEQPTGVQTAALDLFDAIVTARRPFELLIFADPVHPAVARWTQSPGVEIRPVPFRRWGRMRSQLYEQLRMTGQAQKAGARLLYHPINTCPRNPGDLPQIVTLHDLNFHHNPQWYGRVFRTWLEHTTVPGLRRATHVVCISDYVVEDVLRTLGLDPLRVTRVYDGLRALPTPGPVQRDPDRVLAVNPFQPHKNLVRLIDAVAQLRARRPGLHLRVVGRSQANFRGHGELAPRLAQDWVEVTGYLDEARLAEEYAGAAVLGMPSFEEGFGMPLIEAMSFGTPVVTSNVSCLPETAGPAGILVDPHSVESIALGLEIALSETDEERARRVEAGRVHANQFSWTDSAAAYIDLFTRLITG